MFKYKWLVAGLGAGVVAAVSIGPGIAQPLYSFGTAATPAETQPWDIDIKPDGSGLPPGHGSVAQGKKVYQGQCSACHGDHGQGGIGSQLVGGKGTLDTNYPVRTVGSYWPYATTLFDYVRRAMPFNAPQSLTADQTYAVITYILHLNGIVPKDAVMNAQTLPKVKMPNRDGFIRPDPRPDVRNIPCEHRCG
jgi:cytochrome c